MAYITLSADFQKRDQNNPGEITPSISHRFSNLALRSKQTQVQAIWAFNHKIVLIRWGKCTFLILRGKGSSGFWSLSLPNSWPPCSLSSSQFSCSLLFSQPWSHLVSNLSRREKPENDHGGQMGGWVWWFTLHTPVFNIRFSSPLSKQIRPFHLYANGNSCYWHIPPRCNLKTQKSRRELHLSFQVYLAIL